MLISTIIFTDGEERQFPAESLSIGEPNKNLIRIDLGTRGEIIVSLYAVKEIHTYDIPAEAVSPELFG